MKPSKIFLAAVPPAFRETATTSARTAFPEAEIVETPALADAYNRGRPDDFTLVISGLVPTAADASALQGPDGLPRWPLVTLNDASASALNVVLLTRVLLDAVALHTLRQENARLSGDLKTIARRISHDLRSPVGSIHTSADVLREIGPDDATTVATMADIIKQSSGEISEIVNRVSFVAWASVQPTPPGKIDMGDVLSHVMQQLEHDIESTKATVALPSAWPDAKGVATWAQAIWTNFLSNALKHAGPAPKVSVTWTPDAGGIRFALSDRGPGVAPSKLAGLFTPFDRLHSNRVQGLGLPIVERLTKLQGGRCGYEPVAEGGACFYFTLPAFA